MKTEQAQVKEFMLKAGQECPPEPTIPSAAVLKLRVKLIAEELCEFCMATGIDLGVCDTGIDVSSYGHANSIRNLTDSYDAILDLLVVVIGTAVAMGMDIEPGWQEVHRSNMSKFIDGHRREDGKWIKGPSYSPAQLEPEIRQQLL